MAPFQKKRYELRLYDRPLIDFELDVDVFGEVSVSISDYDPSARSLMPMALVSSVSDEALLNWIETRTIPKNRAFVDRLFEQVGLEQGDTMGLIDTCMGLSVNDSFWIVPSSFTGSFEDYNLYENELDEALAFTAYTGYTSSQHHRAGLSSEWTTDGQFPKAWRRIDGDLILYKAGTEGYANSGMEPYSEFLASQVAEAIGLPHVSYGLDRWHGKLASTCPIMNSIDTSLVTFWPSTGVSRFPALLAAGAAISPLELDRLRFMTVFDSLIANRDRHANNYGFIRDNRTGAILGPAPIYDNNLSLFPEDMAGDFGTWDEKVLHMSPSSSQLSFDKVAEIAMSAEAHDALRRLIGFEFENHPLYPLPEDRLEALSRFIRSRARRLLGLHPVSTEELMDLIEPATPEGIDTMPILSLPMSREFQRPSTRRKRRVGF